jgi:hypothetical protein
LSHITLPLGCLRYQVEVLLALLLQSLLLLLLAEDEQSHQFLQGNLRTLDHTAAKATELPTFSTICGKPWGVGLSVQRWTQRQEGFSEKTELYKETKMNMTPK